MNKRILFSIGLIVLALSSCTVGSRRVVTEDVKVSGFDQVNFSRDFGSRALWGRQV